LEAEVKRVVIESPYAGDVEENTTYARKAMRDSLLKGELPIASHLLYTQPGILDDKDPNERQLGIYAGLCWGEAADATVVYIDRGISPGMLHGIETAQKAKRPIEYRRIAGYVHPQEKESTP
jgi:hypothetical protein